MYGTFSKKFINSLTGLTKYAKEGLIFFALIIFLPSISAKQLPFASLNISDGLEDTVIFSIEQDDFGFLWISTRTGINRFDGDRFWTYTSSDGLPHNLARDLHKTKDGTLWVASEGGVAWFDGEKFQAINNWPEKTSARALSEAPDGTLWVATYGAGVIQVATGKNPKIIKQYNYNSGLNSDRIRSIMVDNTGIIWLGTSRGVIRITNGVIENMQWNAERSEIRAFYQHSDDSIWVGTRHGLAHFLNNAFEPLSLGIDLSNQTINTITRDQQGAIWLGTRDFGIYIIKSDAQITHYDMQNGLPDNSVNSIFQDNEGNQWFGTYGGGISRLSTSKVTNWKAQFGMPNPNIYAIADDLKGCIWFGTNGNGVSSLCDNKMRHYTRDDGLPHNKILSTMIDNNGDPWFGTLQGLSHLVNGEFINYDQEQGMISSVNYHILQADDDSIWIGTNNGLINFDGETFTRHGQRDGLPDNRINRVLQSHNGGLWLASANGLTRYHEGKFRSWSTDDGLLANFINDFYEDKLGGLWIATNNGLSYFFQGQFKNWTTDDGLPHNNCTVILPGNGDEVWIGTSRGVAIFDGTNFTVITSREGLVFDLVNRGAGYKDPKGNLWFGTGEGVSRFAADFKPGASNPPPVLLLSVSNNQKKLPLKNDVEIQQENSSLLFDYTAISFQRAPDVNYRYRLVTNGIAKWRETRLRELQINSLAAGNYRFEVTARIGKGAWNSQVAIFNFTVTPPFWRTLWFMGLVIASILAALFYRSHRSRQYAIHLENTVKHRTKQLEDVNRGLDWLANHDSLTQLPNRNFVQQKFAQLEQKNNPLQLGIIVIDLDYFKLINDQYGHTTGDKVLQAFANLLQSLVREDQIAARWGGEEFLIICPQINTERLQALAEQILYNCRELKIFVSNDKGIQLRCSLGFALTPKNTKQLQWEKTIQLADMALYDAKHDGRDCGIAYLWQKELTKDWSFDRVLSEIDFAIAEKVINKIKVVL